MEASLQHFTQNSIRLLSGRYAYLMVEGASDTVRELTSASSRGQASSLKKDCCLFCCTVEHGSCVTAGLSVGSELACSGILVPAAVGPFSSAACITTPGLSEAAVCKHMGQAGAHAQHSAVRGD